MIEDVFEPLAEYRDRFREAFAQNAKAMFERLVGESGVDTEANAATMRELYKLEKEKSGLENSFCTGGWGRRGCGLAPSSGSFWWCGSSCSSGRGTGALGPCCSGLR